MKHVPHRNFDHKGGSVARVSICKDAQRQGNRDKGVGTHFDTDLQKVYDGGFDGARQPQIRQHRIHRFRRMVRLHRQRPLRAAQQVDNVVEVLAVQILCAAKLKVQIGDILFGDAMRYATAGMGGVIGVLRVCALGLCGV